MMLRFTKVLFLLLVVSLPLVRPFYTRLFGLVVPSTDFIFLFAFGFWLIAILRGECRLRISKFYFFLGFYALSLTVSTVFSINPIQSFYKLLGEFYLLLLCILTFNLAHSMDFLKQITAAWLFGTGITILAALAGIFLFYLGYKTQINNYFLFHYGTLPPGNYPRLQALFVNANMLCDFLNVSLMLTVLADKLGWLKKIPSRILQFGIWFTAFFTISPGLGGLFLSFGVWLWAKFHLAGRKNSAYFTCLSGIFLALVFFAVTSISPDTENTAQNFNLPFTEQKFEPSVRILIWQDTLKTIGHYPFTGKGTGTGVAAVKYTVLSGENQFLTDAHNVWLNIFGQLGFFGFIAFLSFCLYLLWSCKFYLLDQTDKSFIQTALSCAFLGAFLFQGLQGSFEDARHLWILFGLLASLGESDFAENNNV